jgi:glutamyl/glutaminyl-tRNA synthetase
MNQSVRAVGAPSRPVDLEAVRRGLIREDVPAERDPISAARDVEGAGGSRRTRNTIARLIVRDRTPKRLKERIATREDPLVLRLADDLTLNLVWDGEPVVRTGFSVGTSDRKVKGTIHWVSCEHAVDASVRLYDRLFNAANPNAAEDFHDVLNPDSLEVVDARLEPALAELDRGEAVQFERLGYFCRDSEDDAGTSRVFNRIVTLRDSWAKLEKQAFQAQGD